MKRIYLSAINEELHDISDEAHHYLKNVLRLAPGNAIEVLTSAELLTVNILEMDKRRTRVEIISRRPVMRPSYSFTVYQCILKREYMDTAVEKYTELGVTKIVPVISERSIQALKDSTIRRYVEIATAASLQSEREYLPEIAEPIKLDKIMAMENADNLLFYGRHEDKSAPALKHKNVQIIIGPEGGFTENEVQLLAGKAFTIISPLKQILKAETAAVVFAGWVQIQLEQQL